MNVSAHALFFSFDGRINRATYWTRAFPVLVVSGLLVNAVLAFEYEKTGSQGLSSLALCLIGLWPVFAVTIKRLHDRGRSAWFLLVILVPVLGAIWLLAEVWVLPGTDQTNRFGDIPQDEGLKRRWIAPLGVACVSAQVFLIIWTFFWPGAELRHALVANEYGLIRLEAPVSGQVEVPNGNSVILLRVDGNATIDDIVLSECFPVERYPTETQFCRVDASNLERSTDLIFFDGGPSGSSTFSFEKADGRVIVVLSVDALVTARPSADNWIVKEMSRPFF